MMIPVCISKSSTSTAPKPQVSKLDLPAWKFEMKWFLLCGVTLILYGTYNWQSLRDSFFKKGSVQNLTKEHRTVLPSSEFWTLGFTLVVVLLTGNILEAQLTGNCRLWPCWPLLSNRMGDDSSSLSQDQGYETSHKQARAIPDTKSQATGCRAPTRLCTRTTDTTSSSQQSCPPLKDMRNEIPPEQRGEPGSDAYQTYCSDLHESRGTEGFIERGIEPLDGDNLTGIDIDEIDKSQEYLNRWRFEHCGFGETGSTNPVEHHNQVKTSLENGFPGDCKAKDFQNTEVGIPVFLQDFDLTISKGDEACRRNVRDSNEMRYVISTKSESTQTQGWSIHTREAPLMLSRGTETDAHTVDCCVSTHGAPCKLIRHCGTTTTGPFMKKLRRAHRLLVETKETAHTEHVKQASRWRNTLERYRQKMAGLERLLSMKDQMMGGTSSRIKVIRAEIKDIMQAVRSSTSTRERLNTQCKVNAALMDVIESKSENPIYGAGLVEQHGTGLKQEMRGPQ